MTKDQLWICDGCDVTTTGDNMTGVWLPVTLGATAYHFCPGCRTDVEDAINGIVDGETP